MGPERCQSLYTAKAAAPKRCFVIASLVVFLREEMERCFQGTFYAGVSLITEICVWISSTCR